jgi:hypothetical protein
MMKKKTAILHILTKFRPLIFQNLKHLLYIYCFLILFSEYIQELKKFVMKYL